MRWPRGAAGSWAALRSFLRSLLRAASGLCLFGVKLLSSVALFIVAPLFVCSSKQGGQASLCNGASTRVPLP